MARPVPTDKSPWWHTPVGVAPVALIFFVSFAGYVGAYWHLTRDGRNDPIELAFEIAFAMCLGLSLTAGWAFIAMRRDLAARRRSEATLRAFYQSSPLMMGLVELEDDDIRHISDNGATARFFGTEPDALQGRLASELGVPRDLLRLWHGKYREAVRSQGPVWFEYEHAVGERSAWLSVVVAPVGQGPYGQQRLSYVAEDISEKRQANDALKNAVEGIAKVGRDGRYEHVNNAYARMLGRDAEAVVGRVKQSVVHPEDLEAFELAAASMTANGKVDGEFRVMRGDGSYFHAHVTMVGISDPRGAAAGYFCFMKDVSDRRQAQEMVRESMQRFQALATLAPVGIFQADMNGQCTYANDHWLKLAGMQVNEAMGEGWVMALHPEDLVRVGSEWNRAALSGESFRTECRYRRSDGSVSHVLVRADPVRGPDGVVRSYLGTVTDITESKRAYERLTEVAREQEDMLRREKSLRRELDHRVRNNLAGLLGLVSLYEGSGRGGPQIADAVRGKVRALKGVHDLISMAPGRSVDLPSVVRATAAGVLSDAGSAAVQVSGPAVPLPTAQASVMAMVLQELCTNAVKYGSLSVPTGRVTVQWDVRDIDDTRWLELTWIERGGPVAERPARSGVGVRLIEGFAAAELRGSVEFEFEPEGLTFRLRSRIGAAEAVEAIGRA